MTIERIGDLSRGVLPITVVVGAMAIFFWAGFAYCKIMSTNDVTENRVNVIAVAIDKLTTRIDDLQRSIAKWPTDALTRSDLYKLCLALERNNKEFHCPPDL